MVQFTVLRLFKGISRRIFEYRAGIIQAVVKEQPIELGREIIVMAGIGGRNCYGIRLVPTSGGTPKAPEKCLARVRRETTAIDREKLHETAHIRALLERERPFM